MAVLIKDMELPKTAFECSRKINPDERQCNITGKVFEETFGLLTKYRCKDCPCEEFPVIAHWIPATMDKGFVVCDRCRDIQDEESGCRAWRRDFAATFKFCPECGAKMEEGQV